MKIISMLLLLCSVVLLHAASDWKLVKDKSDVQIYSQQKPGYKLKQFKAETQIKTDADTILAVLQDTQACAEWVYNCISNDMVAMSNVSKRIYHTTIHSPLWFKDRDFYLQSQVVYDPVDKMFTITLDSKPAYAKAVKGKVRVIQVAMVWRLQYIAADETAVSYQVYIDPKLPIKAINHAMIQKSVFQTMLGLTKQVKNPIYATTKYSESELEMLTEDH